MTTQPLAGVRVLDFSTLLPGPMATLLLAEAGAEVIKIERPGRGDEMRSYVPKFGTDSINFALLNRGKRSLAIDLKAPDAVARLRPLIESADVVVEQFRPGVMDRLGLGYDAMRALNPRIVYCAITGYGQYGPRADVAAHDLNYVSDSGMLALTAGADGAPVLPPALIADIAGGTYPAVLNILLALRERDQTGLGRKLDVAMADNLFNGRTEAAASCRRVADPGRRPRHRRLAPLPDLSHCGRPVRGRGAARGEVLGQFLRRDRAPGREPRRQRRSGRSDRARARDHPLGLGRPLGSAVRRQGPLLHDRPQCPGSA